MPPLKSICVVIPAKNEVATIGGLVSHLRNLNYQVVVVDAQSTDGMRDVIPAHAYGVHVLDGVDGIGPCLLMGMKHAFDNLRVEHCITMDAGGSHSVYDLDMFELFADDYDLIIGSRFASGAQYIGRPLRALLSRIASAACTLKTRLYCSDWTSGLRMYSRKAFEQFRGRDFKTRMHSWQIEAFAAIALAPVRYGSFSWCAVPIRYTAGRSSMTWRIAMNAFEVWKGLPTYARRYR